MDPEDESAEPRIRETCRVVHGAVPLWRFHRARMESAGCSPELIDAVERETLAAAAGHDVAPTTRVRLSIELRGGCFTVAVERRLSSLDVPNGPRIARIDVAEKPVLPAGAAKPLDRSYWDAAHRAARAKHANQAVLVAPDGTVVDGSTASVWIVEGAALVTPPAPPAIAGVARAALLELAAGAGFSARAEPVSWDRLEAADEVLLANAVRGAVGVRGRSGPVAREVEALFAQVWSGARVI